MNSLSDIISSKSIVMGQPILKEEPVVEESVPDQTPASTQHTDSTDQLRRMIHTMKGQLDTMLRMINGEQVTIRETQLPEGRHADTGETMIEGVFTGEKMFGADGKEYSIPPNYSSKSKLVEGDMMKLIITKKGSFIFKQIGPIERKRVIGELVCDPETSQWSVVADGRSYKVLNASVSFYKGSAGDEVVILVPESGESQWGAVENIIHG